MRRARVATLVLATMLTACTGVPTTSSPDTIEHLGAAQVQRVVQQPRPGADPRTLVLDFLAANEADAINHGAARSFLAGPVRSHWLDTTITILAGTQVAYDGKQTVTVTGQAVGTLTSDGIYHPDPNGDGEGGETISSTFTVQRVDGQNRITRLLNGLLLTSAQFQAVFQQRVVYFYDANEQYLIPDLRYTPVGDPQTISSWLVDQLIAGPRPELQNAETNLEFPAQADAGKVTVRVTTALTTIDIPGAGQLDAAHRNRLAGQLAITLDQVLAGGTMEITDNGHPVPIPAVGDTEFAASQFASLTGPASITPTVYFVRDRAVVDSSGHPLPGDLGRGSYGLSTVALARVSGSDDLYVAGTTGSVRTQRLLIGTQQHGLHPVPVEGELTRPSWAPGLDEAWISNGTKLFRVSSSGHVATVPLAGLPSDAHITALRMSPDASRIAMVVAQNHTSLVYVATIARNGSDVRIEAATPITPIGVLAVDVAWNDPVRLFLIGTLVSNGATEVVEVQADGSLWTQHSVGDLPAPPRWITVTQNQPAWVSAGGAVWQQSGSGWDSPTAAGETPGQAPVYLE